MIPEQHRIITANLVRTSFLRGYHQRDIVIFELIVTEVFR